MGDSASVQAEQRANWNAASAGWYAASDDFDSGAGVVTTRLLELGNVRTGQRVLDVATGHGEPALTVARVVGQTGRVVATDIAEEMLDIARERAGDVTNVEFVRSGLESLPELPGGFDAVLSRFGLMFATDQGRLFRDLRGLLRPGGVLAAAVWATQDRHLLSLGPLALSRRLALPQPEPGEPGAFAMADPDQLAATATAAGLTDVSVVEQVVPFRFTDVGSYLTFVTRTLPPAMVRTAHERLGAEDTDAVLTAGVEHRVSAAGTLELPSVALLLRAHAPAS